MKFSPQGKQLSIDAFRSSLDSLSKSNRWVQLGDTLPWSDIERLYNHRLSNGKRGAGNKPARMIIDTLLIKHKMNLSDEETILAIQELHAKVTNKNHPSIEKKIAQMLCYIDFLCIFAPS